VHLLHALAFSKQLPWLAQASVNTLKTLTHAVNAVILQKNIDAKAVS